MRIDKNGNKPRLRIRRGYVLMKGRSATAMSRQADGFRPSLTRGERLGEKANRSRPLETEIPSLRFAREALAQRDLSAFLEGPTPDPELSKNVKRGK